MIKRIKRFILDPSYVLMYLYNSKEKQDFILNIANNMQITYAHIVQIINKLERYKFIRTEKKGRKRYVTLTSIGEKGGILLTDFNNLLIKQNVRK